MRHVVEVDQSIKIEDSGSTVLAFADRIEHAIIISSRVKREALRSLREKGKSREIDYLIVFAAGLFLLLENYLSVLDKVIIDTEYVGHEATIRSFLLRHIWKRNPAFEPEQILFKQVGKKSPAHRKAVQVRKKQDRNYQEVRLVELLRLVK